MSTPRRGSLPGTSRASLGLSKLLTPVSVSVSIDNPLIFLHPRRAHLNDSLDDSLHIHHQSNVAPPSIDPSPSGSHSAHTPPFPSPPIASEQQPQSVASPFSPSFPQLHHHSFYRRSESQGTSDNNTSTVITGTLVLKLLRPKEIKKVIISLWGQSYIGFNDRPYEHQTILSTDLEIDLATQLYLPCQHPNPGKVHYNASHKTYVLDKGHYRFCWSFILPPDLPPYERGQFGRTIHKVIGKVRFASSVGLGFGTIGKNLSSILIGVGGVGNHEVETESYFVAVCNPANDDGEANGELALNFNVSDVSDHLGPYTLSASSAYFTVSGLLQFKLRLKQIPPLIKKLLKIYKITAVIKQQYKLVSMKDRDPKTRSQFAESWPPPQRRKIFVLDYSNVGESDEEWHPCWSEEEEHQQQPIRSGRPQTPSLGRSNANGAGRNSSSRSTSRSRSRIRDLIMTSSRSHHSREREEHNESTTPTTPPVSPHHGWGSSLSQIIRRRDESLPRTSPHRSGTSRSRSFSHVPIPPQSTPPLPPLPSSSTSPSHQSPSPLPTPDTSPDPTAIKHSGRTSYIQAPHHVKPRRRSSRAEGEEIPLVTITDDHSSWEIEHIGRLPNDDSIRPSTYPGTQTNIHIYKMKTANKSSNVWYPSNIKINIFSDNQKNLINWKTGSYYLIELEEVRCCCMLESMVLPPYSKSDPNSEVVQHPTPQHAARMFKCVCGISTETLLKTQNPNSSDSRVFSNSEEIEGTSNQSTTPNSNQNSNSHQNQNVLNQTTRSRLEFRCLPYSSRESISSE
ncbi:uncharacterized protein MELLADRAFT_101517 [Melampsora larici-populina 98AG31]|uniref:Arrestin-like N-terminal domain-containing protein n=1 Tax=Melampsora larici-populina (strain 98AG31 / pathotype 3-4-7) TaxID=747676 RepID=F4R2Z1_MELLP|nr:uncharacterized protein MELLADRAFT_101517 [Melampsora larici-populina 98AG31]EGG12899.1 hypothetical protein MELLADRAFT_101517 [Melampsora larici-populina 98AG31]